jgi:hypothetical protein
MRRAANRVTFVSSPGGFPRGRPGFELRRPLSAKSADGGRHFSPGPSPGHPTLRWSRWAGLSRWDCFSLRLELRRAGPCVTLRWLPSSRWVPSMRWMPSMRRGVWLWPSASRPPRPTPGGPCRPRASWRPVRILPSAPRAQRLLRPLAHRGQSASRPPQPAPGGPCGPSASRPPHPAPAAPAAPSHTAARPHPALRAHAPATPRASCAPPASRPPRPSRPAAPRASGSAPRPHLALRTPAPGGFCGPRGPRPARFSPSAAPRPPRPAGP